MRLFADIYWINLFIYRATWKSFRSFSGVHVFGISFLTYGVKIFLLNTIFFVVAGYWNFFHVFEYPGPGFDLVSALRRGKLSRSKCLGVYVVVRKRFSIFCCRDFLLGLFLIAVQFCITVRGIYILVVLSIVSTLSFYCSFYIDNTQLKDWDSVVSLFIMCYSVTYTYSCFTR